MDQKLLSRAAEVVQGIAEKHDRCTLALIDLNGYPAASTISAANADGIRQITFCTGLSGNKAPRIRACNRAGVCFCDGQNNVSLVGTIEVLTDAASKKEAWYAGMENHFAGVDDPDYCVLRFTTQRVNLWVDMQGCEGSL